MRMFAIIFSILAFFVTAPAQTHLAEQYFNDGTKAARNAQFERAIESYQKALFYIDNDETYDNFLAKVHSNIGICLYRLKYYEAAIEELKKAISLSKGRYHPAFYALGMTHTEMENRTEAISAFRHALRLKKDDGEAWFDLASVLLVNTDLRFAESAFRKSIKYKTVASHDAHNNLGVILAWRGDFSSAEYEFEKALIESNGESNEARNNLRLCKFYKQNRTQTLTAGLKFTIRSSTRKYI